jgi:hypothetical protein
LLFGAGTLNDGRQNLIGLSFENIWRLKASALNRSRDRAYNFLANVTNSLKRRLFQRGSRLGIGHILQQNINQIRPATNGQIDRGDCSNDLVGFSASPAKLIRT